MTFNDLNLNKPLLNALSDLGFTEPTPIQEKGFSVAMSGRDVVGIAQTGTGKSLAFLLPCLKMWTFSKEKHPQILIIVPTRELVVQIVEEVEKLTAYMSVVVVGVYGGVNIKPQMAKMEEGLDVLVATPGRLLDLVLKSSVRLKSVKRLVIDEVDEMLSLGFRPQLVRVLDFLSSSRQNLMFSATMTDEVEVLINDFFNTPQIVEAAPTGTPLTPWQVMRNGTILPLSARSRVARCTVGSPRSPGQGSEGCATGFTRRTCRGPEATRSHTLSSTKPVLLGPRAVRPQ